MHLFCSFVTISVRICLWDSDRKRPQPQEHLSQGPSSAFLKVGLDLGDLNWFSVSSQRLGMAGQQVYLSPLRFYFAAIRWGKSLFLTWTIFGTMLAQNKK